MWKTSNCPLCGGERYENKYAVVCLTSFCPNSSSPPFEENIKWGWKTNPKYMKKNQKRFVEEWKKMGKDYLKWLAKYNGEVVLTTQECINKLRELAGVDKRLKDNGYSLGILRAAEFLEHYHEDCWSIK
jgi:hypothetical protein